MVVPIVGAALLLGGCGGDSETTAIEPATVEQIEGSELSKIVLTPEAVERLDLQTAKIEAGATGTTIPYSAIIYDANGATWAYTSNAPNTFVRQAIVIDHIEGKTAVLKSGPPAGTTVATVAVAELLGAETGIG